MGIIRAAVSAVGGTLADQWLETIQADNMSDGTLMTTGVAVHKNDKRNQNKKASADIITDGSVIMVGQNQCMILASGGKVVDYSADPGHFIVDNKSAPSLFNGQLSEALNDTFTRVKFGGVSPQSQIVYYINTQEIKNIPFGTVNPINYFDNFYNAELYLRAHGYFSIRITDPLKFFTEAVPQNSRRMEIDELRKLYLSEFLTALQAAIGKMSVDGIRISHVTAQSADLAKYMSNVLDEDWTKRRGICIETVGISSISYDEQSKKLIDIRNQGAMLSDASIREGYVQGSVARGIENAGSNSGGAAAGFMGVGLGMQSSGNFMGAASASNQAQMERSAAASPSGAQWKCGCGASNSGKFCSECGKPQPSNDSWRCQCGAENQGNFCSACGKKRAAENCPECGAALPSGAKFCSGCGKPVNQ